MKNVIAIHMEPSGSNQLEHIAKLRWSETGQAGMHGDANPQEWTRAQMYAFVRDNREQAYAISRNDNKYAFLEAVNNGYAQYVKTLPDLTKNDNLLSLPRF